MSMRAVREKADSGWRYGIPEDGQERRNRGPRFRIAASAELQWISEDGRRHKGQGVTRDISSGGVFVYSNSTVPVGAVVQIVARMPRLREEIFGPRLYGTGTVVRQEPAEGGAPGGFAAEVVFRPGPSAGAPELIQ
ncbi:MAG TPA: PilZ domain-containing protein [Terriglobales bacterium]|nr:PilZ domain-containing protein [Terriglobales bacterium]